MAFLPDTAPPFLAELYSNNELIIQALNVAPPSPSAPLPKKLQFIA